MAVPSVPTQVGIITEALDKANAQGYFARARDFWFQEGLNDIWNRALRSGNSRLKTLQTFEVQITTLGKSKYDFASDFDEVIDISLLDGDNRDTATAGGNTSITYAADEGATEDDVVGEQTLLTGGTGSTGLRQNTAYDEDTLVATVDSAWDTNPDATSTYLIVNQVTSLELSTAKSLGRLGANTAVGKPSSYITVVEGVNDRFILDKPPDLSTYGLLISYYTNIHKVNLTEGSTLISKIYQNWQYILGLWIYMRALENNSDSRLATVKDEYENQVNNLLMKELPYDEEFQGFTL